jgi:aspartate/methionine/tyrosine aminotransferase
MNRMEEMISQRVSALDLSGIRKVFDLARDLKDPINLSIGQPDFPVPSLVKEAATSAMLDDQNAYTPTQGRQDLIDALVEDSRKRGLQFEDLIITSGVSGGLLLAFSALLNPGDEVVMTDPYFLMYRQLCTYLGAEAKLVDTYPHFKCTAEVLEPHLKESTKLLVLNFPGNPTGTGLNQQEMQDLADLLGRYPHITVISDEIYRLFHYDGPFVSLSSLMERVITLDGFSKSHAVTGWRVGWASGPKEILQQMAKLQQFTFVCSPAPAQVGCLKALSLSMEEEKKAYQAKRDLICDELEGHYELVRPQGTFYLLPKVPDRYANGGEFVKAAIDRGLLIIPGNVFSSKDTHFRISFAATDDTLRKGAEILRSLA